MSVHESRAVSKRETFNPKQMPGRTWEVSSYAKGHFSAVPTPKQKVRGESAFGLAPKEASPIASKVKFPHAGTQTTTKTSSFNPKTSAEVDKTVDESSDVRAPSRSLDPEQLREIESDREVVKVFDDAATKLTAITGRPVTRTDIIFIFFEMIQLLMEHEGQEKFARRMTRAEFLKRIDAVAENFRDQSSWLLRTAIPGCLFDLATGVIPIVGHMKGDWILGKLSSYFTSLKGMKSQDFFKNLSKMANSFSKMQDAIGNIHNRNADGKKALDQSRADMSRTDEEEETHTTRQMQTWISELIQAFNQAWQQRYDTESRFSSH
jgi:hypothetical protein